MKPPIYKTERFDLKPYKEADEERFIEIGTDSVVQRFMGDPEKDFAEVENEERELFKNIFNTYKKQEDRWFWIWGIYEDEKLVGHFELKETEHTSPDELEIVYMIHAAERKRGIMSEILEFAKTNQTVWKRNIIATVDLENKNSISLLKKWGIIKQEIIKDDDSDDAYMKFWLK